MSTFSTSSEITIGNLNLLRDLEQATVPAGNSSYGTATNFKVALSKLNDAGITVAAFGSTPLSSTYPGSAVSRPATGTWVRLMAPPSSARVEPILSREVASALVKQEALLLALRPDWDGYGADPVSRDVVREISLELREALKGVDVRTPKLVPGADGTVQAEWYLSRMRVFYQVDEDLQRFLFIVSTSSGAEYTLVGEEAKQALSEIIRVIAHVDQSRAAPKAIGIGELQR